MVPMPAQLGVPFAPGTMVGRYELLATIGSGGMASVILARQRGPAGFEKVVVVKIVHPHLAQDPTAVNMLLDEARLAAQIDHPNVVHTYELGEAYGTFYIVMEYLAGESLAQVLKQTRAVNANLSPLLAAKIVGDAAEGLHFAHELCDFNGRHLGIVHRDVSPGNIVVQYNGIVKVVDFGIAKAHGRVTSTQEGELKGKYGYMAPEQIKNEPMDRRSDVFSLGVVLWEALAQRRLFNADNVAATLMQILTADRVPPSHFFPQIPHSLDVACLRALAPDPNDRFATVAEMKQAIDDAVWQARLGAREIEAYMTGLFGQRIQMQHAALSSGDPSALGPAMRHPQPEVVYYRPAPPPRRVRTSLVILVASAIIGISAAMFLHFGRGRPRAPAVAPSPVRALVLDPRSVPDVAKVTRTTAVPIVVAPPAPPPTPVPEAVRPPKPAPTPTPTPRPRDRVTVLTPPKPTVAADVLVKQASDAFLAGDVAAAETAYKQAIAANKGYAPAYRGLGLVYQRNGKNQQAIDALETYLRLAPTAKDVAPIQKRIAALGGS